MSLLVHLSSATEHLKIIREVLPRDMHLTTSQKILAISIAAGAGLVGILTRYLKRKKQIVDPTKFRRHFGRRVRSAMNGEVVSIASSGRRSGYSEKQRNSLYIGSEKNSLASGSNANGGSATLELGGTTHVTPQQLGVMGIEALETAVNYWNDSLLAYKNAGNDESEHILGPEEIAFCKDLEQLLNSAVELQDRSELLFLDERSVLFKPESSGSVQLSKAQADGDADLSSAESFASAQDQVADLREFEEFSEYFPEIEKLPLYHDALIRIENGEIPCRTLRTELVKCGSDGEYLAKLHCLRLAFQYLLKDGTIYIWFVDIGRQILTDILLYADKDPKEFLIGYENILTYIQDSSNVVQLEEELSLRGVKALTFYDIVLDYILMDAFEDLDSPPSSVMAVVQNRWLSNGFKETALTTAVWSILRTKRHRLKCRTGFMAHFYTISEQLSPVLVWGFLGPDEELKETCVYFKEQVMGFLTDIFNFQKCRYTVVEELASDVLTNLKIRSESISQRLSVQV